MHICFDLPTTQNRMIIAQSNADVQSRAGHIPAGIDTPIDGLLRRRAHRHGMLKDIACWAITADAWAARHRQ
jgi:hypothetical protein